MAMLGLCSDAGIAQLECTGAEIQKLRFNSDCELPVGSFGCLRLQCVEKIRGYRISYLSSSKFNQIENMVSSFFLELIPS